MKGNIKKLALVVIMTAIPMLIAVATASAGGKTIQGDYAGTAIAQCLIAPMGFDANTLIPIPIPGLGVEAVAQTATEELVYTFNRKGTGSVTGVMHYNQLPNADLKVPPAAGSGNVSYDFTYTVAAPGDITLELASNSSQCVTFVSGSTNGTSCLDNIANHGVISQDGKTITVTCGPPLLLNALDANGNPTPTQFSCVYSGTFVKQ